MKKEVQDDLFDLIHSLEPAERGYFSKFAQRHVLGEGNNYEVLFQAMLQSPAYDAAALEEALKSKGIQTPLTAAKNHLKTTIFRAMREYNSHRSTYKSLLDGLANLSFLYEKKLYALLRKEIKRLKKIAQLYEEHHVLFKIGDFERRLHKETARKDFVEGMNEILAEMKNTAADFQNQLEFTHLMDQAFVIANKAGADQGAAITALLNSPILQAEDRASTVFSTIYRHQVYAILHMLQNALAEAAAAYAKVMLLWEGAPHLIVEHPSTYRRVLGNFLGISAQLGDFSRFEELISKVRASPSSQPADHVEIFGISYAAELNWRMGTHDWQQVERILPAIQSGLRLHAASLSRATTTTLHYNCAISYFLGGDDAACLKSLRSITEMPHNEQRMDIQRLARVLTLLLIWKRGDLSLLEYEHRSTLRYFEQHGHGLLEQHALQAVDHLIKAPTQAIAIAALQDFAHLLSKTDCEHLLGAAPLRAWSLAKGCAHTAREILEQIS